MPGPVIGNPTPAWLRPENASVLDSTLTRVGRTLADLAGINDPNGQIIGVLNPTPTAAIGLVPKGTLADLAGKVSSNAPKPLREAVEYLSQRYPALMSHIGRIDSNAMLNNEEIVNSVIAGHPTHAVKGRMEAIGPSLQANRVAHGLGDLAPGPVANVLIDTRVHLPGPPSVARDDYINTLTHELTHVAQNVRQTDRAWRDPAVNSFQSEYARLNFQAGYQKNPFEVFARDAADRQTQQAPLINVAKSVLTVRDPPAAVEFMKKVFPDATETDLKRAVSIAQTMNTRGGNLFNLGRLPTP